MLAQASAASSDILRGMKPAPSLGHVPLRGAGSRTPARRFDLRRGLLALSLLGVGFAAALPAAADVVHLTNGRTLQGEVIAGGEGSDLTLVTAFGTLELPESMVSRVERSTSLREAVARTRARLDPGDADALFDLALWCRKEGAETLARELLEEVLALEPEHAGAHRAFGHVREDGRWMTEPEARRARGEVQFRGRWMPREEAERIAAAEALRSAVRAEIQAEARRQAAEQSRREAAAEAGFVAGYGAVPYAPPYEEGGSGYEGGVVYGIPFYGPPVSVAPGYGPSAHGPSAHGPSGRGAPGTRGRGPRRPSGHPAAGRGRGAGGSSAAPTGARPGRAHRGSKAGAASAPRLPSSSPAPNGAAGGGS